MKKEILLSIALSLNTILLFAESNHQMMSECSFEQNIPSNYLKQKLTRQHYKGFIDLGYTFGSGDLGMDKVDILTSHGFQLNKNLFAGLGTGFCYYSDEEEFIIPIFTNVRGTCILEQFKNIFPFIDLKLGYSIGNFKGIFMSPTLGCRLKMNEQYSLNASLGYVMQQNKYNDEFESGSEFYNGFCLRFGIEF